MHLADLFSISIVLFTRLCPLLEEQWKWRKVMHQKVLIQNWRESINKKFIKVAKFYLLLLTFRWTSECCSGSAKSVPWLTVLEYRHRYIHTIHSQVLSVYYTESVSVSLSVRDHRSRYGQTFGNSQIWAAWYLPRVCPSVSISYAHIPKWLKVTRRSRRSLF